MFKDVSRRRVRKADAYDWAVKMKRLPHAVETYASFVRAIDLGRKRQCSNQKNCPRETIKTPRETIKQQPGITRTELIAITGRSRAMVARLVANLIASGFVERRGSKKKGGYYAR